MQILDCTLRDGGYYNSWDFSRDFVQKYLDTTRAMGINYVEIGFRLNSNRGFKGACAFSTDSFLSTLYIDSELSIGVMINASEFHPNPMAQINALFPDSSRNFLEFVRIAALPSEISITNELARILKDKGYLVFVNLMQMATIAPNALKSLIGKLDHSVDILYFADSTGSMKPDEIRSFFKLAKEIWNKPLGLHAHDNLSMALSNTLAAVEEGVAWQDSTFLGMGRGPGNSRTELLWLESQKSNTNYAGLLIGQEFIEKQMHPLRERYLWGTDSFYFLAGQKKIHPSFIQNLHEDSSLNISDKVDAVQNLTTFDSLRYSENMLEKALEPNIKVHDGTWSPNEMIASESILIIADSQQFKLHAKAVEEFIRANRPFVLALNWNSIIDSSLVGAYITCHPHRIISSLERVSKIKTPVIVPKKLLGTHSERELKNLTILDYGVHIVEDQIQGLKNHCEIPALLSLPYALAVGLAVNCSQIYLAGLEGEFKSTTKYRETEQVIVNFSRLHPNVGLTSITPTRYSVEQISVYGHIPS
jgi:4-hydroxy 2-oxovalerate aldolase